MYPRIPLMIKFILLCCIWTIGSVTAQTVTVDRARDLYFSMDKENCSALVLSELFASNPPKGSLMKAYHGASSAAAPLCIKNPAKKVSYFKRGAELLTEALTNEPSNFEIRFLRFATQTKSPRFLGYHKNIEEDKAFMLKNLDKGRKEINDPKVFTHILTFMEKSSHLTKREKVSVRAFSR